MRTTLTAVAAGGVIGALARHGVTLAVPGTPGGLPWGTLGVNVSGCLLIGVLMAWLAARRTPGWVRPFLGVGVLGGYTTFSAYAVEAVRLYDLGHPLLALAYVFTTLLSAVAATLAGSRLTATILRRRAGGTT